MSPRHPIGCMGAHGTQRAYRELDGLHLIQRVSTLQSYMNLNRYVIILFSALSTLFLFSSLFCIVSTDFSPLPILSLHCTIASHLFYSKRCPVLFYLVLPYRDIPLHQHDVTTSWPPISGQSIPTPTLTNQPQLPNGQ